MSKIYFYCKSCGYESPKWLGKCPSCNQWNTFVEELKPTLSKNKPNQYSNNYSKAVPIGSIKNENSQMRPTSDSELNIVLGGGIVSGSVILLAGEPGIGKSTLLLQIALRHNAKVLYISGEEAPSQIKLRADRLGINNNDCIIFNETSSSKIINHCSQTTSDKNPYSLVIVDSIQTLFSDYIESPVGSVSQIKQCCSELVQFAKKSNIAVILIGHITKEGQIAGPKILEHMVDVVVNFEGEKNHMYRLLRASKNRFGPTSKVGVYEMQEKGLRPVLNPSTILINQNGSYASGTTIASTFQGQKTFLVEVQALVTRAVYGTPQRSSVGFNAKRLNMLLAVMEKKCGFKLSTKDVFLNIAGGISISDPSMDLAVIASILSSNEDLIIQSKLCLSGEVGLNGEIRPVPRIDEHIEEAKRVGFEKIIISSKNKIIKKIDGIMVIQCSKVMDVYTCISNLLNQNRNE